MKIDKTILITKIKLKDKLVNKESI